jgi:peptidoglycan pentaglycine glycine transferase (the first glycine)
MPEVTRTEWEDFLQGKPDAHLLQTGEWGDLKSEFGWEPIRMVADGIGMQILLRRLPLGLALAYIPKPCLDPRPASTSASFWSEVDAACRRRRAVFCQIEPDAWERPGEWIGEKPDPGFPGARHPLEVGRSIQPRRTIVVDLRRTEEEILARMKPKCRYNIRLASKKGVTVGPWEDMPAFHQMMLQTGKRDAFGVHSLSYYRRVFDEFHPGGSCELLVARFHDEPLAALMVFGRGRRAWYLYGGSTDAERERMPNYLLQWEAMRWAKQKGCDEYDLWGVPDEEEQTLEAEFTSRNEGLWGVYRFKRGFGGEVRRAARPVVRVYQPILYRFYSVLAGRQDSA